MEEDLNKGFRLKDWEIWPLRGLLIGPDGERHIEPKAMQVLVFLATQPGQVVKREELLDKVWPHTYSGDVSLTRCISELRSILSDERGNSQFIETIPKIGYRLAARLKPLADKKSVGQLIQNTWIPISLILLFLGVGLLILDRLVLEPERYTVTVRAVTPSENSIAVLPFVNATDDSSIENFTSAISDNIRNELSKISEIEVTSRASATSLTGQNRDVSAMAVKLNAIYVLEGSVRKSGEQLRISVRLTNVASDRQLWAATYDEIPENVFKTQDEVAAAVVEALKHKLLSDEKALKHELLNDAPKVR